MGPFSQLLTVDDSGMDPARFEAATHDALVAALIVHGAGQAFRAVRAQAQLTTGQAGETLGLSGARVSLIEADDANLYTRTVAEVAARFGYRATLVLGPIAGGRRIEAPLQGK